MDNQLILYSTNTWLAFSIAEIYYSNKHYVWCTPFFDLQMAPSRKFSLPPSSTPSEIGRRLYEDIRRSDRHSSKIRENKEGIIAGANIKYKNGVITETELAEIIYSVENSELDDFRPLLYIIPKTSIDSQLVKAPVDKKAHPLSEEYLIEELSRSHFDVIDFPGVSI